MIDAQPPASATLLLLRDDPFEVLMVRRNARGTFASSLVFPGGAIDAADYDNDWAPLVEDFADFDEDQRARRIGAIRETWEESSILVAASGDVPSTETSTGIGFRDFVSGSGVRLRLAELTSFAHWITPVSEPRRFDTSFFVAPMPADQVAAADGREIVSAEWVSPLEAAAAARRGEQPIIFPTLMNLERVAQSTTAAEAIAEAAAREPYTVQPVFETDEAGSRVIVIPAEAGYGLTHFRP